MPEGIQVDHPAYIVSLLYPCVFQVLVEHLQERLIGSWNLHNSVIPPGVRMLGLPLIEQINDIAVQRERGRLGVLRRGRSYLNKAFLDVHVCPDQLASLVHPQPSVQHQGIG